jgi:hypothetical protein
MREEDGDEESTSVIDAGVADAVTEGMVVEDAVTKQNAVMVPLLSPQLWRPFLSLSLSLLVIDVCCVGRVAKKLLMVVFGGRGTGTGVVNCGEESRVPAAALIVASRDCKP